MQKAAGRGRQALLLLVWQAKGTLVDLSTNLFDSLAVKRLIYKELNQLIDFPMHEFIKPQSDIITVVLCRALVDNQLEWEASAPGLREISVSGENEEEAVRKLAAVLNIQGENHLFEITYI